MPAAADWSLGASEAPALLEGDLPGLWARITGRVARYDDGDFGETAHFGNQAAQPGDVLVECLDRMLGHQPYLPVI